MLRIIPGPCIGGLGVRGFSEAQGGQGLGFRGQGLGFRGQGLGFRGQGLGVRV